jgi:hypothetical protein
VLPNPYAMRLVGVSEELLLNLRCHPIADNRLNERLVRNELSKPLAVLNVEVAERVWRVLHQPLTEQEPHWIVASVNLTGYPARCNYGTQSRAKTLHGSTNHSTSGLRFSPGKASLRPVDVALVVALVGLILEGKVNASVWIKEVRPKLLASQSSRKLCSL